MVRYDHPGRLRAETATARKLLFIHGVIFAVLLGIGGGGKGSCLGRLLILNTPISKVFGIRIAHSILPPYTHKLALFYIQLPRKVTPLPLTHLVRLPPVQRARHEL